jgi:hypothetical protein
MKAYIFTVVEGDSKLKDVKRNFILQLCKSIILKFYSLPIDSLQNKEDEGTSTSQNTIRNTVGFTSLSQNSPQTTPPLENPPSTQSVEHYSLYVTLNIVLLHRFIL